MTFGLALPELFNFLMDANIHSEYGLIGDPKWGDFKVMFPFMIYEAKAERHCDSWTQPGDDAWKQGARSARLYLKSAGQPDVSSRTCREGRPATAVSASKYLQTPHLHLDVC